MPAHTTVFVATFQVAGNDAAAHVRSAATYTDAWLHHVSDPV